MKTLLAAAIAVLALPAPALAHGGGSHGYVSTIERIVNGNGIEAKARGDGHVTLTAPIGKPVVVWGYEGEPYLRFADGKVYENRRAPTAYVNRDEAPPSDADAHAPPQWRLVEAGPSYTWHDHRTHWMAAQPPDVVTRDPHTRHHILDWRVEGTVAEHRFTIANSLGWVPAKNGFGWNWFVVVLASIVPVVLFFALPGRRKSRP